MNTVAETTTVDRHPAHCHAVCLKSIFAGSAAAAVMSLMLLALGAGLGFATMSPYSGDESGIAAFTAKMAIWLVVMQWASAGIGGYIAGRLRPVQDVHDDETFFRDTAHGFLTFAVATLFTAAFLATAAASVATGGVKAATAITAGAAAGAAKEASESAGANPLDYYADGLFRGTPSDGTLRDTRVEAGRILVMGMKGDAFPEADKQYLASLVASRTGLDQTAATARVDETLAQLNAAKAKALETADKARKATSAFSIFTALSMFVGAFIAAVAAAIGSGQRPKCLRAGGEPVLMK